MVEDETGGAQGVKRLSWFPQPSSNSRCCQSWTSLCLTVLHVLRRADNPVNCTIHDSSESVPQSSGSGSLNLHSLLSLCMQVKKNKNSKSINYLKEKSRASAPQAELINTHSGHDGLQTLSFSRWSAVFSFPRRSSCNLSAVEFSTVSPSGARRQHPDTPDFGAADMC